MGDESYGKNMKRQGIGEEEDSAVDGMVGEGITEWWEFAS